VPTILPDPERPAAIVALVLLDCPVAADIRLGRRQAGVVLAALAALALAWVVVTPKSVPLYDGIGAPDEAYRYVQPPSGTKPTKPPLPATADSDAGQGTNPHPFYVSSDEIGPQVLLFINRGALDAPSATGVRVTATPLAPDHQPTVGSIDGNVYRVAATALVGTTEKGAIKFGSGSQAADTTVTLRATTARQPGPSFVYRLTPAAKWRTINTVRVGNDIYRAQLANTGDYALAFGVAASGSGHGSALAPVLEIGGPVVAILVALIVVVRLTRRRQQGAP
jgi:hypothetical protein